MGIFNKRHGIHDVIEYDGSNEVLIWKHPIEDFNDGTTLIVGPSQEAIFVRHGQVLERFTSGTYTLDMENHAFLRAIKGTVTGGVTPYQCTVYFVNKLISMAIDWGTDSPIRMMDPRYNVPMDIRSYGDYAVQIDDGRKLFDKLVGTTLGFTHDELKRYFNDLLATKIRALLAGVMIESNLSGIGIDQHLETISNALIAKIKPVFEPYGLDVIHFTVASISYSGLEAIEEQIAEEARKNIGTTNELERHRKTTDVEAEDKIKQGKAQAEANKALGMSEKEKAVAEIGRTLAGNPGPMMGGAGMPGGFPGMIGGSIVQPSSSGTARIAEMLMGQSTVAEQPSAQTVEGVMPGASSASMLEEVSSDVQIPDSGRSMKERMDDLKYMYDKGMLTQEEYEQKRREILHSI